VLSDSSFSHRAYFFWNILACESVAAATAVILLRFLGDLLELGQGPEVKMRKYGSRPRYKILRYCNAPCAVLNHLLLKIYSNKCECMELYDFLENL